MEAQISEHSGVTTIHFWEDDHLRRLIVGYDEFINQCNIMSVTGDPLTVEMKQVFWDFYILGAHIEVAYAPTKRRCELSQEMVNTILSTVVPGEHTFGVACPDETTFLCHINISPRPVNGINIGAGPPAATPQDPQSILDLSITYTVQRQTRSGYPLDPCYVVGPGLSTLGTLEMLTRRALGLPNDHDVLCVLDNALLSNLPVEMLPTRRYATTVRNPPAKVHHECTCGCQHLLDYEGEAEHRLNPMAVPKTDDQSMELQVVNQLPVLTTDYTWIEYLTKHGFVPTVGSFPIDSNNRILRTAFGLDDQSNGQVNRMFGRHGRHNNW